jgi:predicted kinase
LKLSPTDKTGNGQVIQDAKELVRVYPRRQESFVWNATNTPSQIRVQLIDLFTTYKAKVSIVYIEVPYQHLHGQNKNRDAAVPAAVLEKLTKKLEVPALWEAQAVIYHMS